MYISVILSISSQKYDAAEIRSGRPGARDEEGNRSKEEGKGLCSKPPPRMKGEQKEGERQSEREARASSHRGHDATRDADLRLKWQKMAEIRGRSLLFDSKIKHDRPDPWRHPHPTQGDRHSRLYAPQKMLAEKEHLGVFYGI